MDRGVDYAWARPIPQSMQRDGIAFACRYIGIGSQSKHLTPTEGNDLSRHGIAVVALAEASERDPLWGYARGFEHAMEVNRARKGLQVPDSRPVYYAVDFDAKPSDMAAIGEYFRGVRQLTPIHQIGVYGSKYVVDHVVHSRWATWGFQTYAWSRGQWSSMANLRQTRNNVPAYGSTVDLCDATVVDYGQWLYRSDDSQTGDTPMPSVADLWSADVIPVGGDPTNRFWRAGNVLGHNHDLLVRLTQSVEDLERKLDQLAATLAQSTADSPQAAVADMTPAGKTD